MPDSQIIATYIYEGNGLSVRPEDLKKLTHLNLAFGTLQADGVIQTDHLHLQETVKRIREVNPQLKIILSIGSGHPDAFSGTASTEQGRKKVAAECARIVETYQLSGIDYDWEYPCCPSNRIASSPDDKENFTALCREIRAALDTLPPPRRLFTIAAAGDAFYLDFVNMGEVQKYLDYIFLMTYDLRCGFHSLTGHHTNLYPTPGDIFHSSADGAIQAYEKAGVPVEKIVMGVAFYSRQWIDVPDLNHGHLQYVAGNGGYGPDYTAITQDYLTESSGFTRYWDDNAKAPYLFDGKTYISYDDPESIAEKCRYVKTHGCAGVFAWEYNNDKTGRLLEAMASGIGGK